jgi:hypothetical protein
VAAIRIALEDLLDLEGQPIGLWLKLGDDGLRRAAYRGG